MSFLEKLKSSEASFESKPPLTVVASTKNEPEEQPQQQQQSKKIDYNRQCRKCGNLADSSVEWHETWICGACIATHQQAPPLAPAVPSELRKRLQEKEDEARFKLHPKEEEAKRVMAKKRALEAKAARKRQVEHETMTVVSAEKKVSSSKPPKYDGPRPQHKSTSKPKQQKKEKEEEAGSKKNSYAPHMHAIKNVISY